MASRSLLRQATCKAPRGSYRKFSQSTNRQSYEDTIKNLQINKSTRVIFQGFTGRQATVNAAESIEWGTKIVGGTKPNFEGEHQQLGLPVLPTVRKAMEVLKPDATGIYVPASMAAAAIEEAIEAEVPLIVAVAEHIPLHDILRIHSMLATQSKSRLIGANSPGIISAVGKCRIGFQPLASYSPGPVAVAAKSGTLSYEAVTALTREGVGQSLCIGVGGDPISGTGLLDALKVFEHDENTKAIVLIGEIGGEGEIEAAEWIRDYRQRVSNPKPIAALVAGKCAVPGKVMGHAGAWATPGEPSAEEKLRALENAGATVVHHPGDFGKAMKKLLGSNISSFSSASQRRGFHTMRRSLRQRAQWTQSRSLHLNVKQATDLLQKSDIAIANSSSASSHLLMLAIHRAKRCPSIIVALNHDHSKALRIPFSYQSGPQNEQITSAIDHLNLNASQSGSFSKLINSLWSSYRANEAVSLSVSITAESKDGELSISNPDLTFDDAAFRSSKRQADLHNQRDNSELHPSELRGENSGIVYIPLDQGDGPLIGTLVNGAGLAMNTVDCLNAEGLQVSNFLDTGGKATAATVAESMRLILLDDRVKVLFVNIFGGLTKCDMIAEGVLEAMRELKPEIPVVVRLRGTREIEAEEVMKSASTDMKIFAEGDFQRAVEKVKDLLNTTSK